MSRNRQEFTSKITLSITKPFSITRQKSLIMPHVQFTITRLTLPSTEILANVWDKAFTSLRKQPKFRYAKTGFPAKRRLRKGWSKFSTNQKHYPDLVSDASLVWNHYFCARFSDVISRETSDDVAKSRLFSEVKHIHIEQRILPCGQILVCIPHQWVQQSCTREWNLLRMTVG